VRKHPSVAPFIFAQVVNIEASTDFTATIMNVQKQFMSRPVVDVEMLALLYEA